MKILRKYRFYRYFNKMVRNSNNYDNNTINKNEFLRLIRNNKNYILIDVRNPREYRERHLTGAINISLYDIDSNIVNVLKDKSQYIFFYCTSGSRSLRACMILSSLGYENVYNLIDVL